MPLYRETIETIRYLQAAMTPLLKLYRQLTHAAGPALDLLLGLRVKKGKEDPARLMERRGKPARPRPAGNLVWVHAASVGESQSALILIHAIERLAPSVNILVTTGTVTSATLMERRLPPHAFHQYVPLDQPQWVNDFLNHWKPDLALWMESELWPNMLLSLKARAIPAVLVNARLSEKSFSNWKFVKNAAKEILDTFSMILAQTDKDTAHFHALSATHAFTSDNIKYSAAPLPFDPLALSTLELATESRKIWVYASTHDGEEDLACRVHKRLKENIPDILSIIVPRHPERRDDIAKTCFQNGLSYRLRSHHAALPAPDDDIYIADTLGELGLFYRLSPIAMIGRSFSNDGGGGHNPVEAAQLGCAVLTGPNNQYQRQLYDDMRAAGAVIDTIDEEELYNALYSLLSNDTALASAREKTAAFAAQKTHVIDHVLQKLSPVLQTLGHKNAA